MAEPVVIDYLKAVERPQITVEVDGKTYLAQRASLGQHVRLDSIKTDPALSDDQRIVAYIATALAVDPSVVEGWFALDVMRVFDALDDLNNTRATIHLDFANGSANPAYQYPHRALAMIVTRLASAFGWTRHYILNELTWDEARCYLQEIAISEHAAREYEFSLSELAYDQHGRQRPFPPLPFPAQLPIARPQGAIPPEVLRRLNVGVAGVIKTAES